MGVKDEAGADGDDHQQKAASVKHTLHIAFSTNEEPLSIKAKSSTPFSKIYAAVATHRGIAADSFKLSLDGRIITSSDTPASLELEEEEQIDFHVQQIGGGRP
ncbi:hypothetical protein JCM10207_005164 [Rhodosporidiobolus poonsookiae]